MLARKGLSKSLKTKTDDNPMAILNVLISYGNKNGQKYEAQLPDDAPIDRIISALLDKMGLSKYRDRTYQFLLERTKTPLVSTETLSEAGVQNGDVLRLQIQPKSVSENTKGTRETTSKIKTRASVFCERCGHQLESKEKYCPVCGMAFGIWQSYFDLWRKGFVVTGKASRSEFWSPLAVSSIPLFLGTLFVAFLPEDDSKRTAVALAVYVGVMAIPFLTLACRRLHDIGQSSRTYLGLPLLAVLVAAVFQIQSIPVLYRQMALVLTVSVILFLVYCLAKPSQVPSQEETDSEGQEEQPSMPQQPGIDPAT